MTNNIKIALFLVIEILLFGIVLYAVYLKVINFEGWKIVYFQTDYTNTIDVLRIGPYLLPILELTFASMVLMSKYKAVGFYGIIALMCIYSLHILYRLFVAKDHDCSCMGIFKLLSFLQHLYLSLFIIVVSVSSLFFNHERKTHN